MYFAELGRSIYEAFSHHMRRRPPFATKGCDDARVEIALQVARKIRAVPTPAKDVVRLSDGRECAGKSLRRRDPSPEMELLRRRAAQQCRGSLREGRNAVRAGETLSAHLEAGLFQDAGG